MPSPDIQSIARGEYLEIQDNPADFHPYRRYDDGLDMGADVYWSSGVHRSSGYRPDEDRLSTSRALVYANLENACVDRTYLQALTRQRRRIDLAEAMCRLRRGQDVYVLDPDSRQCWGFQVLSPSNDILWLTHGDEVPITCIGNGIRVHDAYKKHPAGLAWQAFCQAMSSKSTEYSFELYRGWPW